MYVADYGQHMPSLRDYGNALTILPWICILGYRMPSLRDSLGVVPHLAYPGLTSRAIACRRFATTEILINRLGISLGLSLDSNSN